MKRLTNSLNQYKFDDLSVGMEEKFKAIIEPSKMAKFLDNINEKFVEIAAYNHPLKRIQRSMM